jgi:hypothetical protein
MGSAFTSTPDTSKTDLTTTTGTAIATIIVTPTNIAGTAGIGTIIGTITIEINACGFCSPMTNLSVSI